MGNRFREKVVEEGLRPDPPAPEPEVQETVPVEEELSSADGGKRKVGRVARNIGKVLGGDILSDKLVLRQIPLLILCMLYLLLIVANRYKIESLSREKAAVIERITDLREHHIQMQKRYQERVKISQIAEDLGESGIGITSGPPYEIEK